MTNSIICGAGGKMGKVVFEIAKNIQNVKIVGGVDKFAEAKNFSFPLFPDFAKCDVPFDVVIDFSHPDALDDILNFCIKNKRGVVLSTTGYNETQKQKIKNAATKIAVFQSFNMSLGINLLCNLVNQAAKFLKDDYDIEIIEKHHNQKIDAPSGTALMLADSVSSSFDGGLNHVYNRHGQEAKRSKKEIGISSIRGGNIVGEHEIMFIGRDETITFTHKAASKEVFATGALRAAIFLKDKKPGLYSMKDLTNF